MVKLIAVVDSQWGVSKNEKIPWGFSEDMLFFKKQTMNSVVLMGRSTFLSLKSTPLKSRTNCVISSTTHTQNEKDRKNEQNEKVEFFTSLEKAINKYTDSWIIGGAMLYNYALENDLVDLALITHVHKDYDSDKFMNAGKLQKFSANIILCNKSYSIIEYTQKCAALPCFKT